MKQKLFLLFFLVSISLKSQILNFEKFRPNIDTSHIWKMSVAAGIDLKKKTKASTVIHSEIGAYYLSENNAYYALGEFNITRVDNERDFEQGFVHFRAVINRKRKVAYEPFIQFQYDFGKGLKRRHLIGNNLRINFSNDSTVSLSLGLGVFYENENWTEETEEEETITLLNINAKSNNYISTQWLINEWVSTGFRYNF